MKPTNRVFQQIPLEMVGSSKFGRYPKISVEMTINMIISDGWLVPFPGYKKVITIGGSAGQGRSIYSSDALNKMFVVINNAAYYVSSTLNPTFIGNLNTFTGDVYIAENNAGQVAFSDGRDIWIYDAASATPWSAATNGASSSLGFTPGYLTFQNGRFISPDTATNSWRLSNLNNGLIWSNSSQTVGQLQTKASNTRAAVRVPSKGNQLFVFGKTVTESWFDVGAQLFPYQRSTNFNIDYGCANQNTIAYLDDYVVWLGKNEEAGYAIMVSSGGNTQQISTDGINFLISHLSHPEDAYGFIYKQDGHVIYQITWYNDNLSYIYDFETKAFFNVTNPALNYHIAKDLAFFNGHYYFISLVDGDIYELNSDYSDADTETIPRIRIPKNIRLPDQSRFVLANIGFTTEMGQIQYDDRNTEFFLDTENYLHITTESGVPIGGGQDFSTAAPRIDLCLSKDGGMNFGSSMTRVINPYGHRVNRCWWTNLGYGNDIVPQFRFYGHGRFLATNGVANIYQ